MSNSRKRLRQIAIDEKNYETLRTLGHARDSFNDVLTQLLQNQNYAGVTSSSAQNTADTTTTQARKLLYHERYQRSS